MGKLAQALVHGARLSRSTATSTTPGTGPRAHRRTTRWRWSTRSTRTASRARRPPRSRSWTRSATLRTSTACRSATRATSPPTGGATRNTTRPVATTAAAHVRLPSRGAAPIVDGAPVRTRIPSLLPSGSATRPPGGSPKRPATSPAAHRCGHRRQILAAYRLLAGEEGVFCELASAASVAGLLQAVEAGQIERGSRVVCTVTGNGLKDPDWALAGASSATTIPVDAQAAAAALGLA